MVFLFNSVLIIRALVQARPPAMVGIQELNSVKFNSQLNQVCISLLQELILAPFSVHRRFKTAKIAHFEAQNISENIIQ